MWDNGGFDFYGMPCGPDYEELILARQEAYDECGGDCSHCFFASTCPLCDDGGVI